MPTPPAFGFPSSVDLAIQPYTEGGGVGGGGLNTLYSALVSETTLAAVPAWPIDADLNGTDELVLTSIDNFEVGKYVDLGLAEHHKIIAVDEATNTITLEEGIQKAYGIGAVVQSSPMMGSDATIQLPMPPAGQRYSNISVNSLFSLPRTTGPTYYAGRSWGEYFYPNASYAHSLTNFSYWESDMNIDETLDSYIVGIVHATTSDTNAWTIDFNPMTSVISFVPFDANLAQTLVPRLETLIIAGGLETI